MSALLQPKIIDRTADARRWSHHSGQRPTTVLTSHGCVVLHGTEPPAWYSSSVDYLLNINGMNDRKTSIHYTVTHPANPKYGCAVVKSLPETYIAHHAGSGSTWRWGGKVYTNYMVNVVSIGIEIEAPPVNDWEYPVEQLHAVAWLVQDILSRNRMPWERVTTHKQLVPTNKDPRNFSMSLLHDMIIGNAGTDEQLWGDKAPFNPTSGIGTFWLAQKAAGNYLGPACGPEIYRSNGTSSIQVFDNAVVKWDFTSNKAFILK